MRIDRDIPPPALPHSVPKPSPAAVQLNPYRAPPGAVPFDLMLEALNRVAAVRTPAESPPTRQPSPRLVHPRLATPLIEATLGEVLPTKPRPRMEVVTRVAHQVHAGPLGNLLDVWG